MKHVATAMSRHGGPCADCGKYIQKGESVFKFAAEGKTTQQGNGPGVWVCFECMVQREGYVKAQEELPI